MNGCNDVMGWQSNVFRDDRMRETLFDGFNIGAHFGTAQCKVREKLVRTVDTTSTAIHYCQ